MPKKPEYIKTPGFIIEVPKDRRRGFFTAPKSSLVYWAFKNRPRVFISEKLIFTFNGKPVAEALVAKVEGPGKGEGEYQKWHKVYWKPVTFRRFKVVAAEDVLYHVALQKNLDDILENGLKVEYGYQFFDDVPKSTYLTERRGLPFWKEEIASYYGDPQVVLKVNRKGLNLIPDAQGTQDAGSPAFRVEQDIPPSMIKIAAGFKTADHDMETESGEKYWAGVGNAASGILPVCPQKGTVCLAWRSQYVQSPDCWGTIGGAVQGGKSPQGSAKTELAEETGYTGGISLTPAYVFTDGGFTYHNYIGVVGSEFSFSPKPLSREEYMVLKSKLRPEQYHQLIPGWETDHIQWVKYETVLDDMNENPEDYHPGMLKLFKHSKDTIERALGIKKEPEQPLEQPKNAAHSPACNCEMCRSIPAWKRPWLMGKCPEFALALSNVMPDAQFVAIGNAMFEHVGLRKGDVYYDVRGQMTKDQFAELFGSNASMVHDVDRELVMKDAYPSYIGHEDELAQIPDFKAAVKTVRRVFGKTAGNMLPTSQPPDVRVLPCPSGKKKYFDKSTVLMKARGLQGTEAMAYQCPKCHWWHMTSVAQHGPNPTYRNAAEQMHMFPSSQDAKFQQWFKGSKVVDANGNPMPVYHGTRSSVDFDTFAVDGPPQAENSYEGENTSSGSGWDPTAFMGAHFAEETRVANQFAQGEGWTKSRYEGEAEAPRVIQVFLRITNPKDFGTESNLHNFIYQGKINDDEVLGIGCRVETGYNPWEGDDDPEVQKQIEEYYQKYENDQSFRAKENEYLMQQYRPMDMEDEMLRNAAYDLAMQARHRLEQSGVDGIRYKNEIEGGHAWIAFAPQQIKSVNSQFNPQDQRFVASVESDAAEVKIVPKSKGLEAEAWYEGQRVGFVYLHKMEDAPGNPRAPKNSLMVDAAALNGSLKGKSIGLKMYRAGIDAAQEAGYERVYEGIEHSEDAANLWERLKQLYPTEFDEDWGVTYIPLSKTADWKRNVLLPAALSLGLGAPSMAPSEMNPQQQQIQTQRRQEAEANRARQEQIDKLIEAISRAEGAKPERNNPGNIADFNTGEIKSFDTLEEGKGALAEQLERIADGVHPFIKPEMTLRQAGLIYSNGDPNWAHNVSLIMHVPQSTKMKDLIEGATQQADTQPQPSGRTGAWLKKAAGFAFRSFKKLWHVGDMNAQSKQEGSLEGSGLSVSIHPEEWMAIAEIGGDTWELTKAGNKFLNFHRLSKQQRKQITAWGVGQGLVEEVAIGWRWVYYDSEADAERYMEYATEQEARDEMEGQGEGEVVPAKGSSMKGTEKLKQRSKNPRADDMVVAFDLLVTVYAEDELDCDGVWWEDTFDPANLSAPRGVIFPGKLSSWRAKKVRTAALSIARDKFGVLWAKDPELALTAISIPDELPEAQHEAFAIEKLKEQKVMADALRKKLKGSSEPKIVHRGPQGFNVELWNGDVRVGHLQIDVNGDTAIVKAVDVDEDYQRQGIATKLYAAAKVELKKRGVKTLKGSLEGSGPAQIRKDVFGEGNTKYYHGGDEVDYDKAVQIMDKDYGYTRAETRVASQWKHVPVTDEWINRAKVFLKEKWEERHKELGREGIPTDLKGACKFASMFAQKLFGGQMVGNADHQVLKRVNRIIDLTDLYDPNTLRHDKEFWLNPEHEESLKSCEPRVQQWVDEFMQMYWNDAYMKTGAEIYLYHGTSAIMAEKIMLDGAMPVGSYWGTERIADTYAEEAVDAERDYEADAEQAILRIPLSRFSKAALKPDENSVAEPLTYTLKRTEEELYAEWQKSKGTWEDSLRIYESVRYDAPIQITKTDRYV